MPPDSTAQAGLKREARSRLTNGKRLFDGGYDGRSRAARRLRDLVDAFARPFGGMASAPEPVQQLVRRAAALSVQAEAIEGHMAAGEAVDAVAHATLTNSLSRTLAALGRAKPKPTPYSVHDYLREKAQAS